MPNSKNLISQIKNPFISSIPPMFQQKMEPSPGRPTNPDVTPSPETDHHQPEKSTDDNDDTAGIGRSYECAFCKRGFTNAQALGGHMNIHRKDKAKAKQKFTTTQDHHYSSAKSNENYTNNLRYNIPPTSSIDHHQEQKARYYYMPGGGQVNYQVYLPSSNPNSQIGDYSLQPVWRPEGSVDCPNLSLRIGQSEPNEDRKGNGEENEVDLELRLGHDP